MRAATVSLGIGLGLVANTPAAISSARLLGPEPEGLALDFLENNYAVRDLSSTVTGAATGLITFSGAENATRVNANGYIETVAAGTPRIDYSPSATAVCKGLLVEEERTNICLHSSDFSNAVWQKTNITLTPNATTAPDGTLTAYKIEATTAASVIQAVTATATSHVYTIFAKQGSASNQGARFLLRNSTTATNLLGTLVDYSNGSFIYTVGSSGVFVEPYRDGWWRITLVVTSGVSAGNELLLYVGFTGGGVAGQFLYAWGADFQAGSYSTSHIPTGATSVKRTADLVSVPTSSYPYVTTEGTLTVKAIPSNVSSARRALQLDDGTGNERITLGINATPRGEMAVLDGGVSQATISSGTPAANALFRVAARWKASDFAMSANGGAAAKAGSGSLPTVTTLRIGGGPSGLEALNGWVQQVAAFPRAMSDNEIESRAA